MTLELRAQIESIKAQADAQLRQLDTLEKALKAEEKQAKAALDALSEKASGIIDADAFLKFFGKPYVVIHTEGRTKTIYVAVPKFIKGFQVGWLHNETDTFYTYKLDQYTSWLGDAPKELLDEIAFKKYFDATVEGGFVYFQPSDKDAVKKQLRAFVNDVGDTSARIIRGHEFDVLAEIIKSGCLPFKPTPVTKEDLKEPVVNFKLRDYQEKAVREFKEKGAIGVFYPTGAGKSLIALYCMASVKGPKLIVTPSTTLIEQWAYYLETFAPGEKDQTKLVTYQGYRNNDEQYSLVVFDECQRLPADTFSRLATINAKYRIGLSASPHREDGRESYIYALTGFPVGLNWPEYMQNQKLTYHPITVHVVKSQAGKINKLRELVKPNRKTLVFCDSLELGKEAANSLNAPFVSGESINRLATIEGNNVTVISRVGDLGVSIKDLEHVVEIDFLFGSRQQELQRTGRLMHSEATARKHDILMTQSELESYGKRLWSLQEKGFTVRVIE